MGRYSLILEELDGRRVVEISKAKKTSLKKIDLVTTKVNSRVELFHSICGHEGNGDYDFYIVYRQDGKEKRLPIAYQNKTKLADVKMKDESTVNTEDKYFRQILKTFLEAIKRNEYLRILKEDRVLTSKLEEYMEKWKYEDNTDFTREKVAQYMSSYKQLRAIIFSFEKYNNRVKQKRR